MYPNSDNLLPQEHYLNPIEAVSVSNITNSHLQNLGIYNVQTIDFQSLWPKIWDALGRVRVTALNGTSLETSSPVDPLITASTKLKSTLGDIASATMKPAVLGGLIIDQFVLTAALYLHNYGQGRIISCALPSSTETQPVILKMDQPILLTPAVERTRFITSSHCADGRSEAGRKATKTHFILLEATNGENTRAEDEIAQVIAQSLATLKRSKMPNINWCLTTGSRWIFGVTSWEEQYPIIRCSQSIRMDHQEGDSVKKILCMMILWSLLPEYSLFNIMCSDY